MLDLSVLIDEQTIYNRIDELAREIEKDYGDEKVIFLCVLKGSFPFIWELAKRINKYNITFEFMQVSTYGNDFESSGKILVTKDISCDIKGKNIIIIEDIIDTGITLNFLVEHLKQKNPKSLKIATLLDKPSRRKIQVPVDYIGFSIDDVFVIGFGLDYEQEYRNIPYIGYVKN